MFSVINQLAEHLSQWSCAISFPELAVVPLVHLRKFLKVTTADRFRRQIKQLVDHVGPVVCFCLDSSTTVQNQT